ncbi:MAG: hypothetical protein DCC71_24475 [Proteobacteria bacterium]|nr:MAG: hypothetical protein DCC71_24475 [Pseudomonadota bacterium]
MQAIGGLVTAINLGLALFVGVRLLRLGARTRGPESWLGVYFLFAAFLGAICSITTYTSWADPDLALPDAARRAGLALYLAFASAGMAGIALFTQRVFRPRSAAARRCVAALAVAMAAALAGVAALDRFEVKVLASWPYWISVAARWTPMAWMAGESLAYWARLEKRRRVGLADALLVNRFLLWGAWAATMCLLQLSDPAARLWYVAVAGSADGWSAEHGLPIVQTIVAVTSVLGAIAAAMLVLAFFPTPRYRRWIEARAGA